MASLPERLGDTIRKLRSAAGFSQESFAAKTKVHRTYMGTLERGDGNPTLDVLVRVANGLKLSAWELIREAEESESRGADRSKSGSKSKRDGARRRAAED